MATSGYNMEDEDDIKKETDTPQYPQQNALQHATATYPTPMSGALSTYNRTYNVLSDDIQTDQIINYGILGCAGIYLYVYICIVDMI